MKKFLMLFLALICAGSMRAQSFGASYSTVYCLNIELDGSITVRVTGSGRNKVDALSQARKNAVYNVIFKGVKIEDRNSPVSRPLILEVNAEEKYEAFFNKFFSDGGKYTDFVSLADRRIGTNKKEKGGKQVDWSITLRVLRPQLKAYLEKENIIKK